MSDWTPPDPIQSNFEPQKAFSDEMDAVFGKGKWHVKGGYRSPQREDELRDEGAATVRPGATSHHSEGTPDAPGAYDITVDGMTPWEAASKLTDSGSRFAKLYPEGKAGPEGAHLHIEPLADSGGDWKPPDALTSPSATTPKPAAPAPAPPPQQASLAQSVGHTALNEGRRFEEDRSARMKPAAADLVQSVESAINPPKPNNLAEAVQAQVRDSSPVGRLAPVAMAGLNYAGSQFMGPIDTVIGRPVEQLTGIPRQTVGDVASLALPIGDALGAERAISAVSRETGLAGKGAEDLIAARKAAAERPTSNTLAATTRGPQSADPAHAAAVGRLEAAGVKPALHQRIGGAVGRFAESAKSDPYTGNGIRASEKTANDSFNRALYNKALKPLGEHVGDNEPVGRAGIKDLQGRFDSAYTELKPHIHAVNDGQLQGDLAAMKTAAAKLGAPQQQQFESILQQDVLHHMGPEGMDGETYLSVKSDLLRQAREFRSSGDPNVRGLGRALNDVADALSESASRGTDPKWKSRLRDVDDGYAMLTRIEDAASRRTGGMGEITPMDLLAAAKKGDSRVRKRGFGAGDALLQDFGEDAHRVLTPGMSDSGTPERQATNRLLGGRGVIGATGGAAAGLGAGGPEGAIVGTAIGAGLDFAAARVTNALARRALTRTSSAPRNYLKAADQRLKGRYLLPAGAAAQQPPQGQ